MEQIKEDYERICSQESVYLQERENELWLWWNEQWRQQEGTVEIEGIEEEEFLNI
jgi:hypothetical protein